MILFRRLMYRVFLRTRMEWSDRFRRNVWVRCAPREEWRGRKHIHAFIEDGVDGLGKRWKSICGRYYHGPEASIVTVEAFEKDVFGACDICWNWFRKHKEEVLTAERLVRE